MSSLNSECPIFAVPSIKSLVAARNNKIVRLKGIIPDYEAEMLPYQRVKTKRGFFSWCSPTEDLRNAKTLERMVYDFSRAYMQFEHALIGIFLSGY